jgi:hypothetical protein
VGIFLGFIIITYFILYNCSTKKLSEYEKQQQMQRDQNLILSKIRYFKEKDQNKEDNQYTNIVNLPLPVY